MSRIVSVFNHPGHAALIPYITVGYPSIEASLKVVPILARCGCDMVELGIRFYAALGDGAPIQKASFLALKNGVTLRRCLEVAGELSHKVKIPMVFMSYFNPILSFGLEEFCRECVASGIDGLIVPDLPPEEGRELEALSYGQGLDLIYLLAPTSTEARIRLVTDKSRGFVYLVSVAGVTGARAELPAGLEAFATRVKRATAKPVCVGFGISTPEQAGQVARMAHGVIVGSRIIQLMETEDDFLSLSRFVKGLREVLDYTH